MSTYKKRPLGTIGHLGTYSFHETKNYTSGGEGGLLIINDEHLSERAEIIREKGTNRSQFFRGQVDKYTWSDIGSSFLPSELQAAFLWAQLENASKINDSRLATWDAYNKAFEKLEQANLIELPTIPDVCKHNAHMYYIKLADLDTRTRFIKFLKSNDVMSVFHYVPLHSSPAGLKHASFFGEDKVTTNESNKLVRLPMFFNLKKNDLHRVINVVNDFFA